MLSPDPVVRPLELPVESLVESDDDELDPDDVELESEPVLASAAVLDSADAVWMAL